MFPLLLTPLNPCYLLQFWRFVLQGMNFEMACPLNVLMLQCFFGGFEACYCLFCLVQTFVHVSPFLLSCFQFHIPFCFPCIHILAQTLSFLRPFTSAHVTFYTNTKQSFTFHNVEQPYSFLLHFLLHLAAPHFSRSPGQPQC